MKAFLYKAKGALALTLAMSMFCPQVFAAEAAAEQDIQAAVVVEVTEEVLPAITYEEALQKAKKHSPDLRALQDQADFLQEAKEDLWDAGVYDMPNYEYTKWVNPAWYAVNVAAFQTIIGTEQVTLYRKSAELGLEVLMKRYFADILQMQDTLELTEKNAEITQRLYVQGQTKRRLGMISGYDLEKLKLDAQKAKDNVKLLEASLEQTYIKFNNMIGENAEKRFTFVYDTTFEPYTMTRPLDQYIYDMIKNHDLSIQLQELTTETAKFNYNFRSEMDDGSKTKTNKLSYENAQRDLKTAKEEKEVLMRNTYLQIQQLETQYASAEADLKKAEAEYRAIQARYQAGFVTKTVVEQVEMAMITAQNELDSIVRSHDMLVFMFENPALLMDTSAAGGGAAS